MTSNFFLDWAGLSVSLFNAILLWWLGLTVAFNAERKTWGMWLAAGGLLGGGLFFTGHTALLGHGSTFLATSLEIWWRTGTSAVVGLPFAWYLVILWYSGCWEIPASSLWRSQRAGFGLSLAMLAGLVALLFTASVPSIEELIHNRIGGGLWIGGIPVLLLLFPLYSLACTGLSLQALRHPVPSARMLGDQARRRARPWLTGASFVLLGVSLLVGAFLFWVIQASDRGELNFWQPHTLHLLGWVDLGIEGGIAVAVGLIGQAIAVYEVFTGKSLPRQGLIRLWKRTLVLAAGFSLAVCWSLVSRQSPVYILILSALILAVFLALLGWRQYVEREKLMEHIRPFVASQRMFDRLTGAQAGPPEGLQSIFPTVCEQVLGVQQAILVPLGSMAPLLGDPVVYPPGPVPPPVAAWAAGMAAQATRYAATGAAFGPGQAGEYSWWLPLWRAQALSGILVLGEKKEGGLFTQEEIEIAQSAGEQVLDMLASAELARRLVHLQRQQMAESQVYDRRLRRALHDEILPQVHQALLAVDALPGEDSHKAQALDTLSDLHRHISGLLRGLKTHSTLELHRIGLVAALHKVAEDELEGALAGVEWALEAQCAAAIQSLRPVEAEVLFYAAREAMRNAAAHARRQGGELPRLKVSLNGQAGVQIVIEDDGGGDLPPGSGGSGQGLSLHSTMLSIIGGTLRVESLAGGSTRVVLELPRDAQTSSS
ncbi:MAG: hypothetical protein GYA17_11785 [Chloroflexi bacterium]|nr:hypothetical protein [Chloroflexota bacterium]